jgi:hypothetical protein
MSGRCSTLSVDYIAVTWEVRDEEARGAVGALQQQTRLLGRRALPRIYLPRLR